MGERLGESVWDGWAQEQSEKRIAELAAKKIIEAQEERERYRPVQRVSRPQTPPTVKDVLLKTWAQDTEAMAHATLELFWNVCLERYEFPDGSYGLSETDGLRAYLAYLNSAAEAGK